MGAILYMTRELYAYVGNASHVATENLLDAYLSIAWMTYPGRIQWLAGSARPMKTLDSDSQFGEGNWSITLAEIKKRKFEPWLYAHPDHAAAYLEIQHLVDDIRDLPDELIRRMKSSNLTSDIRNGASNMKLTSETLDRESMQVARQVDAALEEITGHRCAFAVVFTRPHTLAVACFQPTCRQWMRPYCWRTWRTILGDCHPQG